MVKVKAVLFDLDDTLISEKEYVKSGYSYIATLLSSELNDDTSRIYERLTQLFNESPRNVFNRLFDVYQVPYSQDRIIELVHAYRNHLPVISFFEDVLPCVTSLQAKGIKTGIITDGFSFAQRQKLKATKAAGYFNEIIVTDELGTDRMYWKPHPQAFQLMKEKFKVDYDEMIYIGDNPEKDFHISSVHPIRTIRIHRDGVHAQKPYLNNIRETHSIHTLNELSSLIENDCTI